MRIRSVLGMAVCVLATAAAAAERPAATRSLTFEDRVRAQEAIERVYYKHQIGTTRPFEVAVPRSVLEAKVRKYLEQTAALQVYWKTAVTDLMLERELERMVSGTRMPERLLELYAVLGNDAFLIKECLARATLVDRLAHNFLAFDPAIQGDARRRANDLRRKLETGELNPSEPHADRTVLELTSNSAESQGDGLPTERMSAEKFRERLAELAPIGQVSGLHEGESGFAVSVVLSEAANRARLATYTVSKVTWDDWWRTARQILRPTAVETVASGDRPQLPRKLGGAPHTPVFCEPDDTWLNGSLDDTPIPRSLHSAVWTGAVMVVWGGVYSPGTGARYDPATDSWAAVSTSGAPVGRNRHVAVWTGSHMLIWGGNDGQDHYLNSGGQYDPVADSWTTMSSLGAPAPRESPSVVWTGSLMVVWGGDIGPYDLPLGTGGRYDPTTDTWTPTSAAGAPGARSRHSAVWTGTVMVVWGGGLGYIPYNDGARYDPSTDSWLPVTTENAPTRRYEQTAVWTGQEVLVWGGYGDTPWTPSDELRTGARYDPVTDTWTAMTTEGSPQTRRAHTAVWTGVEMVVWGGYDLDATGEIVSFLDSGGRYDPGTNSWAATAASGSPSGRRHHTAIWTGSLMVVWGGSSGSDSNTGGRYDPQTDSWTPTDCAGAPEPRWSHQATWTGTSMIIWGGYNGGAYLRSGAKYDPVTDSWEPMSMVGAPTGRTEFTMIWAGQAIVVWGGSYYYYGEHYPEDGGRYDPNSDTWRPISTAGAPSPRKWHTAVWTGEEMVVWGGYKFTLGGPDDLKTGGRYNPFADSWRPTSLVGAPYKRYQHAAVWTGQVMVVWGVASEGGRYDPINDTWSPTSTAGAPVSREWFSYVWTGSEMIVWGGYNRYDYLGNLNDGGRYNPVSDAWTLISDVGAPSKRVRPRAFWTGTTMLVWGGDDQRSPLGTGGRYDLATDSWLPTSTESIPSPRTAYSAVWTGHSMIVWGGGYSGAGFNDGGQYFLGSGSDDDGDGYSECQGDCDDANAAVYPGAPEICDGRNDNCSDPTWPRPALDEANPDGDSYLLCQGDCDDTRADVFPFAPETCEGLDNDCDGVIDEGVPCDDGDPCTDDLCGGLAGCTHVDNVAPCDDGNFCTSADVCASGVCSGTPVEDGAPCSDGDPCTVDACSQGTCGPIRGCDDGNVCNGLETCIPAIGCGAGYPLDCDDGDLCDGQESCNPLTGCVEGLPLQCDDGLSCNGTEICIWYFGCYSPLSCDDGNQCTTDTCGPTGCTYTFRSGACDDGIFCTTSDTCVNGICVGTSSGCDDNNVCTSDCTSQYGCSHEYNTVACDDGNPCTVFDRCAFGVCRGDPFSCDDGNACTFDWCDLVQGCLHRTEFTCDDGNDCTLDTCDPLLGCTFPPMSRGTPCNDFFNCTVADVCNGSGWCMGTSVCDDGNPCTDDLADEYGGCVCTYFASEPGLPCDDGDACTADDVCDGARSCLAGPSLNCDDGNGCTEDSCNPLTGCSHGVNDCDDGNPCTVDTCDPATGCRHDPALEGTSCDDGNTCTIDTCDPATGCRHELAPEGTTCDNGNVCDGAEYCDGYGACYSVYPPQCDDRNACTLDGCDPAAGCTYSLYPESTSCDDGNACTTLDACSAGSCHGTTPVVCLALDQCHDPGVCDPASGLCSSPMKSDGTACDDASLCSTGDSCQSGTCTPAFSGLNEPNPRSTGYYKRLCVTPHSGDQLTDADAACVATIALTFSGISTVADLCAELMPSQPNNDACDRADDDLMALALNICRARVCTAQGLDSQCGSNANVGQSLAESDAILSSASRTSESCAQAKCLAEEVNTGRALELNSLTLRREGGAVRLSWRAPFLNDGNVQPTKYHVWRRVRGSMAPFTKVASTADPTYLDTGAGAFEYEVTAVMN